MNQKFELFYPTEKFYVHQKFGESLACTPNNSSPQNRLPIVDKINGVCPVGFQELYPLLGFKGHTGMDLFAPDSSPVYYAGPDGFVEEVQTEPERGLGLGIITNEMFDFDGGTYYAKTRYWHLKSYLVNKGQQIKTGQLIGYADSTGLSSGSHLHFELKAVQKALNGSYTNVKQDNGYFGAIDPESYFNGYYAKDSQLVFNTLHSIIAAAQKLVLLLQTRGI